MLSLSLSFSDTGISKQCKRQNSYACIPLQDIYKDIDVMEPLENVFFVVAFFKIVFRCDTWKLETNIGIWLSLFITVLSLI